ncbi:winged helix DNA-binding domain-containing protein [Myceligenerans pegani]|uniref:AlkZ family DNA glycosylase n=1 Tax=Myceligenerans pegani TaxID=2776917 RepID=A0ABR9N3G7_9MICO|nr:winged helix DNA-binding domain-containing protein [Myceligenerans sp. TRM 65318]MBE1878208.1 AlkZ family DNA glycosylase [Myceligenerans sp. TRM 65318]MBE3020479.1 AlkZ family DNA glycosylase [Myceligenerans sp. TRM 65318]
MSSPVVLSPDAARRLRLRAQGLVARRDLSPAEVVRRMVALQGQDLPAVLRAIAIRCRPGTTLDDVRAAFDSGELVRGWTQRGTLFATTPRDLAALLSLTGERVRRKLRKVHADEGLDDDVVRRAAAVAREALADGAVSRATLMDLWQQEGVPTQGQRGYHLIVMLALDGLLHWGPFAGTQQLMVATAGAHAVDRSGEPRGDLHRIARAYFATRGPATVDDLAWWLGLPKTPVRATVAEIPALQEVEVEGRAMLMASGAAEPDAEAAGVALVPGFDEIVLGYQDRGLVASKEAMRTVVPFTNGVFRPAVLLDGRLVGTWRRAPKKDEPPFELIDGIRARDRKAIERAIATWKHG